MTSARPQSSGDRNSAPASAPGRPGGRREPPARFQRRHSCRRRPGAPAGEARNAMPGRNSSRPGQLRNRNATDERKLHL